MRRAFRLLLVCTVLLPLMVGAAPAPTGSMRNDTSPHFGLGLLGPFKNTSHYQPKNPYNIFINYELGMHCVGFDMSYCCIIPPYNSVQAQAVRSGIDGQRPPPAVARRSRPALLRHQG